MLGFVSMAPWYMDPANTINRDKSHGSKGGNATRLKWRYPPIDGPYKLYEGSNYLAINAGEPRIVTSLQKCPNSPDSNGSKANRSKSPVFTMDAVTSLHKCPSNPGSKGGKAKRLKWTHLVQDYEGPSSPAINVGEPRIVTSLQKCPNSPDSNGSKANRSKSPVFTMDAVTSLHKCPSNPGSKGGKAKRLKWTHLVQDYEGPSSPGTKVEEPRIVTPLQKRPSNPGIKGGVAKKLKWSHSAMDYEDSSSPGTKTEGPNIGTKTEGPNIGTSLHKLRSNTGKCLVCSSVDDHPTSLCPYLDFLPDDAIVSSG